MQYGQTNGIPQGNMLSDLIAELILGYADSLLTKQLDSENISDYTILRYRDDYRIFSNDRIGLERISFILQEVLSQLNFQINSTKTDFTEDIVRSSIKKDKLAYFSQIPLFQWSDKEIRSNFCTAESMLYYILQFSKSFPNSAVVMKLMMGFKSWYSSHSTKENINVLSAILVKIILENPKSIPVGVSILSNFVNHLNSKNAKKELLEKIYNILSVMPNQGILQLWLQRITRFIDIDSLQYSEELCKIVDHVPGLHLWNFSWLDKNLTEDFPLFSIIDDKILQNMQPTISSSEFNVFDQY